MPNRANLSTQYALSTCRPILALGADTISQQWRLSYLEPENYPGAD